MNKKNFPALICLVLCSVITNAQTYHGITHYTNRSFGNIKTTTPANLLNTKFKSLTVAGPLQATNLQVEKQLLTYGEITGESISCESLIAYGPITVNGLATHLLTVYGSLTGSNIAVSKQSVIYGPLLVTNSHFEDITIYAETVRVKDSHIHNIIIKAIPLPAKHHPQLILEGSTSVSGQIIFESGDGEIIANLNSYISNNVLGSKTAPI